MIRTCIDRTGETPARIAVVCGAILWTSWACSFDASVFEDPCTSGRSDSEVCRDSASAPPSDRGDGGSDGDIREALDTRPASDLEPEGDTGPPRETGEVPDADVATDGSRDSTDCAEGPDGETCADADVEGCVGEIDYDDPACRKEPGESCEGDEECLGVCEDDTCAHRIVVTSETWTGNLGGVAGADQRCQRVVGGRLPGDTNWRAIISEENQNALDRLTYAGAIRNLAGEAIADGRDDLWDEDLDDTIAFDETGAERTGATAVEVWSGTESNTGLWDGAEMDGAGAQDCRGWTSESALELGEAGASDGTGERWIQDGNVDGRADRPCDQPAALYCIDGQ